jgi:predicted molibdopterin-dependent oxidoreductase YjgC
MRALGEQDVSELRINGNTRCGQPFSFLFDGEHVKAYAGETIASALTAAGKIILNTSGKIGQPRGVFCCIGICYGCLVTVDGAPNIRACQTEAREGMVVETQSGNGTLRIDS